MLKRTPLRRCAKKRARQLKAYSLLRKAFLKAHPFCQIWIKRKGYNETEIIELWDEFGQPERMGWNSKEVPFATDIHHVDGRGPNLLNVDTWLAASRDQHMWAHANPSAARKLGLMK